MAAVKHASIEIDGITVVAGVNDTGKSTVSKALWCMFDSFYKYEEQFDSYRIEAIRNASWSLPSDSAFSFYGIYSDIGEDINKNIDAVRQNPAIIKDIVRKNSGLYFDDESAIPSMSEDHRRHGGNVISSLMAEDLLSEVLAQINRALPGDLYQQYPVRLAYVPAGYTEPINARNISAGMKIFAIIKLLLQNGSMERKSTLVLDEPEVHLHPEWQLVFAEIIVLLQRAFDLHILLTTHSPYFLRAIQVYAAKHSIASRCKYYQSKRDGKWCTIADVTESTEVLFDELVRPFEELDREMSAL